MLAFVFSDKDETESLADTEYSYNTWDHPENAPLRLASKEYSKLESSPLSIRRPSATEDGDPPHIVVEDEGDGGDEVKGEGDDEDSDSIESSDVSSPDPTLPIMPTAR